MTLIINPLEKLLAEKKGGEVQKTYLMIYRNAQRILRLINQLMDIRKLDNLGTGGTELLQSLPESRKISRRSKKTLGFSSAVAVQSSIWRTLPIFRMPPFV